ncbi:hypothetical protein IG631_02568 [Alternaria alternata]|nr:hypothetical protein IG631_02568 [Alternaria alternata]
MASRTRSSQGGSLGLHDALFALLEHLRGTSEARATRFVAPDSLAPRPWPCTHSLQALTRSEQTWMVDLPRT